MSTDYPGSCQKIFSKFQRPFLKVKCTPLPVKIRRSSRSIGAQIAEAWGKRRYEKYFISKLTDADGELLETQHWIETAQDAFYISGELSTILIEKYNELGKMLNSMINKSSTFCREK